MLYNALDLFDLASVENFELWNNGSGSQYLYLYTIKSAAHRYSYIRGYSNGIAWNETNNTVFPGTSGAYFFVNGNFSGGGRSFTYGSNKYINVSMMVQTNGVCTGNF